MRAHKALIAWTPAGLPKGGLHTSTIGMVAIGPVPEREGTDWTADYSMTGGAAFAGREKMLGVKSIARLMVDFHTIVVRDGIDPRVAHKAFLVIDEYRKVISPDTD